MNRIVIERQSVFEKIQRNFLECVHKERTAERTGETGLHNHQIDALVAAEQYFQNEGNRTALIVLLTGCRKSGIAVLAPYILGLIVSS